MTVGIVFTVLAAASFAMTGFVANELVGDGTPPVIVGFYEASFGLLIVASFNARRLRQSRVTRSAVGWTLLAGAGFSTAFASFYSALRDLDYSVGAPILGAVPLVSYVMVLFLLRGEERMTPRALIGAALVVGGVGIIGAST